MKPGSLPRLIIHNPTVRLFTDPNNAVFLDKNSYPPTLFFMPVTFPMVDFRVIKPYILVGTNISILKMEAVVSLQPARTLTPEHTLSNPEDHNTTIQNENLHSLVMFVLTHHLNVLI
jgi:hypothetical protein